MHISFLINALKNYFTKVCFQHREAEMPFSFQPFNKDSIHLALARDGLIEEQAAAVLLFQTRVFRPCGAGTHAAQTGHTEGLEAVGGERWRRCRRVRLVTGGGPAPVAPRGAVAGRGEGTSWAVVLPRTAQTFWGDGGGTEREERHREGRKKENIEKGRWWE